jgi:hypothetical protein
VAVAVDVQDAIVLRYNRSLSRVLVCSPGGTPYTVAANAVTPVDIVPPPYLHLPVGFSSGEPVHRVADSLC